jgi:hypothetical protein
VLFAGWAVSGGWFPNAQRPGEQHSRELACARMCGPLRPAAGQYIFDEEMQTLLPGSASHQVSAAQWTRLIPDPADHFERRRVFIG